MKVSVFGLGYVGFVTGACLASLGHAIVGVDLNRSKVNTLESGHTPILEPGMDKLVADSGTAGCLRATVDSAHAVWNTEISFLCVGTPSLRRGKLDLGHVVIDLVNLEKARRTAAREGYEGICW